MWVSTKPTAEDRLYLQRMFSEFAATIIAAPSNYAEELAVIAAVNAAVTKCAPRRVAIPSNGPREPRDLYEQRQGICFDLSRSIEKGLRSIGLQVRHVSVFSREPGMTRLRAMLLPSRTRPEQKAMTGFVDSHALSEVRTQKGWLAVDSLSPWLSLDDQGLPLSLRDVQRAVVGGGDPALDEAQAKITPSLLRHPFTMVYGLYSRHGRFFPPYLPYPNVNPREIWANISAGA